jgi:hypothetical protein
MFFERSFQQHALCECKVSSANRRATANRGSRPSKAANLRIWRAVRVGAVNRNRTREI